MRHTRTNRAAGKLVALGLLAFAGACGDGSTSPPEPGGETLTWSSLEGPLLGETVGLAVADDGSLVATLADGSLWRASGTASVQWERITAGPLQGRAWETATRTPQGAILAAAGNALFRSADGGRSWSQISGPPQIAHFSVFGDEILATDLQTIHRSTDDGRSWTSLGPGPAGTLTVATARLGAGGIVAATSTQGLRYSPDDGATWQPTEVAVGFFNEAVAVTGAVLVASRAGGGGLLRTVDGTSWDEVAPPLGGSPAFVDALVADDAGILYAGHLNSILRSDDGGVTWTVSSAGTTARIRSIAPGGAALLAAGDDGVWRFPAGAAPAERVGLPVAEVTAVERLGNGTVVVGARAGVFADLLRRPAGGAWEGAGLGDFEARALASDGLSVLAATVGATESGAGAVLASTDGGASWDVTLGLADVPSLARGAGRVVAIVTASLGPEPGVHVSGDGGNSWTARGALGTAGTPTAVAHSSALGFLVAIRDGAGSTSLQRSTDGGQSWSAFGPGPASQVDQLVVLSGGSTVCARTIEGEVHCRDQGVWAEESAGLRGTVRILAPGADGDLWAGSTDGVFRLPASEAVWEDRTGGLPARPISALRVYDQVILAGSGGGGAWLGTFD